MSFANTFSHSVACLFVLLVVSFAAHLEQNSEFITSLLDFFFFFFKIEVVARMFFVAIVIILYTLPLFLF